MSDTNSMNTEHHDNANTSLGATQDILDSISLDELLAKVEKLQDGEMVFVRSFSVGSKKLDLSFRKGGFFVSFVSTVEPPRIEGETTQLYADVREYLQRLADRTRRPIRYVLSTLNDSLKNWALTKGKELWQWDEVRDTGFTFTAEATVFPQSS